MLLDVGGVDYFPRSPRFEVVYHFLDMKNRARVRLRCVPEDDQRPEVPSLAGMWPSADPAEREVYDLFGVVFTGHPNLTRILLPSDFEGHPLRKDYPLRGPREKLEARFAAEKNRFTAPKLAGEGWGARWQSWSRRISPGASRSEGLSRRGGRRRPHGDQRRPASPQHPRRAPAHP